jgi:type I restriction enzyme S subunit
MFELVEMKSVCNISSGGTPSRKELKYYGGDIKWAKISDLEIAGDGFIYDTDEKITSSGLLNIRNRIFEIDTLFFAMYGSVGKTAITKSRMSCNQAILGITPKDKEIIDLSFLKYWFDSMKERLLDSARGVALKNLSAGMVKDLKIPLPPLKTQQRIAGILDDAAALRDKTAQLLIEYDLLAQSVFLEMFGDPVRNSKDIQKISLGELTNISSGSTPSRKKEANYNGNIPWVKTGEVNSTVITDTEEKISKEGLKNSSCKLYEKGSLIIAMYGQGKTRGKVAVLGISATTNQACAVLAPSDKINFTYLFEYIKMVYLDLRSLGRGGGQPNLNAGLIKSYKVLNPPIALQNQFAEKIALIEQQKALAKQELQESEDLFNCLLQQAFKGEL